MAQGGARPRKGARRATGVGVAAPGEGAADALDLPGAKALLMAPLGKTVRLATPVAVRDEGARNQRVFTNVVLSA